MPILTLFISTFLVAVLFDAAFFDALALAMI